MVEFVLVLYGAMNIMNQSSESLASIIIQAYGESCIQRYSKVIFCALEHSIPYRTTVGRTMR